MTTSPSGGMSYSALARTMRFFGFLFFLFLPALVSALTVSPLRQTIVVDQGEEDRVRIEVTNNSTDAVMLVPEVDAFSLDEKGRPIFGAADAAIFWVRPEPRKLLIRPKETKSLVFVAPVPKNAEPGAHYLGLFATQKPPEGGVGIGSRVGSLLFLYVSGEYPEELQKVEFGSNRLWYLEPPMELRLALRNTGKIHVVPQGLLAVRNGRGEAVGQFLINEEKQKVLPGAVWRASYKLPLPALLDAGKLTAVVNVQYGSGNQHIFDAITFWYAPREVVILVAVFAVLAAVFLIFLYKTQKKRL